MSTGISKHVCLQYNNYGNTFFSGNETEEVSQTTAVGIFSSNVCMTVHEII
jgi:hypothetical protein